MSFQFSIIIICRNEAGNIGQAISSILSLTDDIVVYDTGSTDGTLALLQELPVQLHSGAWEGFGMTRQKAAGFSNHNWVFIVDADEVVSEALAAELRQLNPTNENIAYRIQLANHIGLKHIRHGTWGRDFRVRLYNKNKIGWNDSMVHEKLVIPDGVQLLTLKNKILHYTAKHMQQLSEKMNRYATLTAEQYLIKGKKSSLLKRMFGPKLAFVKSYFLKLGFLDGRNGLDLARTISHYTSLKYKKLYELLKELKR